MTVFNTVNSKVIGLNNTCENAVIVIGFILKTRMAMYVASFVPFQEPQIDKNKPVPDVVFSSKFFVSLELDLCN